ncbi:MAG: hypothetical protein KDC95_09785 [Planctomycetes bacterium]|nr:hypothetical protein [Planctomycetota bacterium]
MRWGPPFACAAKKYGNDPEKRSQCASCGRGDALEICGLRLEGCLYELPNDEQLVQRALRILDSTEWIDAGFLPMAGGIEDQTALWKQSVELTMRLRAEFDRMRKAAQEQAGGMKRGR